MAFGASAVGAIAVGVAAFLLIGPSITVDGAGALGVVVAWAPATSES